jgi:hypothetical protein
MVTSDPKNENVKQSDPAAPDKDKPRRKGRIERRHERGAVRWMYDRPAITLMVMVTFVIVASLVSIAMIGPPPPSEDDAEVVDIDDWSKILYGRFKSLPDGRVELFYDFEIDDPAAASVPDASRQCRDWVATDRTRYLRTHGATSAAMTHEAIHRFRFRGDFSAAFMFTLTDEVQSFKDGAIAARLIGTSKGDGTKAAAKIEKADDAEEAEEAGAAEDASESSESTKADKSDDGRFTICEFHLHTMGTLRLVLIDGDERSVLAAGHWRRSVPRMEPIRMGIERRGDKLVGLLNDQEVISSEMPPKLTADDYRFYLGVRSIDAAAIFDNFVITGRPVQDDFATRRWKRLQAINDSK